MKLVIVSGMSGSGKSVVLGTLEDAGYYCIDNLPVGLAPEFARQMLRAADSATIKRSAVAIDARNMAQDLGGFSAVLSEIRSLAIPVEIVFLDAAKTTLIRRFSETRRKHPLTNAATSLEEAIEHERTLLAAISEVADIHIDTTHSNLHQLRDIVMERVVKQQSTQLSLLLTSFGFKNGVPVDSNFVFDVRCLPNPHWDPVLRKLTGLDRPVADFLGRQADVDKMYIDIEQFLKTWLPLYAKEKRSYLTIAIGCTGGQHRSVYLVERLAGALRHDYASLLVRHRELA